MLIFLVIYSVQIVVEQIVNTRNDFAHESKIEPIIAQNKLSFWNHRFELVLLVIFYDKLGVSSDKVFKRIQPSEIEQHSVLRTSTLPCHHPHFSVSCSKTNPLNNSIIQYEKGRNLDTCIHQHASPRR